MFLFAAINGPPDPLHGDTFYANVRSNAEVCLI